MPSGITRIFQMQGHCGPTSVQMMLRKHKVKVNQRVIAEATLAGPTLMEHGCRIDQLARAVDTVQPDYRLLAKYDSTIDEVRHLNDDYGLPVGVEWRGKFFHNDGSRYEDGHYSVVTHVDRPRGIVMIIDPDETSALRGGQIGIDEFEARWWDENWLGSPIDPASEVVRNFHLTFVVVPASLEGEMQRQGMQRPTMDLMKAHHRLTFDNIKPEGDSE
jgi:hypothetical protein